MMRMLLSAFTFEPKEYDLATPGMATSIVSTAIQTLLDHKRSSKSNTTTLKKKISQKAKPKSVVQMKCCGLM